MITAQETGKRQIDELLLFLKAKARKGVFQLPKLIPSNVRAFAPCQIEMEDRISAELEKSTRYTIDQVRLVNRRLIKK
jgi:hypothetical protein